MSWLGCLELVPSLKKLANASELARTSTLIELARSDEAERVLLGSLETHPGSAATNVHLGRIALKRQA